MTDLEKLEQEAYEEQVHIDYLSFDSDRFRGLYVDGSIALNKNMGSTEAADVLAEELEHHYTTVGNILDLDDVVSRKQERLARLRAYNRRIGLSGIIQGYRKNCRNQYELAECLGVSEDFLSDALKCYREKYGLYAEVDGYIIMFEPHLAVMEKILE